MTTELRPADRRPRHRGSRRRRAPRRRSACRPRPSAPQRADAGAALTGRIETIEDLNVYYGAFRAIRDVSLTIKPHAITAIIGPSGCGKSTFLRTLNRMHELTPGHPGRGLGPPRRRGHLRPGRSTRSQLRRRGRDGLPAAQPVPDDVDLRQRRGRPATHRPAQDGRARRGRRALASGGRRCGTRSRTSSSSAARRCRAASSSGCASPARWPSTRR